ncbi:MAG: hypothetical protein ACJATI_002276 [Halioglobus sp.]|jgi:hypothetical protein
MIGKTNTPTFSKKKKLKKIALGFNPGKGPHIQTCISDVYVNNNKIK